MRTLRPEEMIERLETEPAKIGGDNRLLPEINNSNDFAKPYIEIDQYGYNYVCRERGVERFRKLPFDIDELIYEVFHDVTSEMATKWAIENSAVKEDFRLKWFAKRVDLMTKISRDFGTRLNNELQSILKFELLTKEQ
jgi:hypothetical protein